MLTGVYFNEDLIGGAFNDYKGHFYISDEFRNNFIHTFNNYDNLGHRQSPIFYIIRSLLTDSETLQRIFFLHLYLLIPLFLYKCLKIKYKTNYKNNLKLLCSSLLLLPTFRSYSIWPDPHLLGFLFFLVSIYYFIKFENNNKISKFSFLNTLFLSFSAYISPNFGVFVIFFIYEYLIKFKLTKNFFLILLLNLLLSIPFFYYLFFLEVNFLFNNNGWDIGDNIYSLTNISNKIIIISSIFLFFIVPLIDIKFFKNLNNLNLRKDLILTIFIIYLISCYFFDFSDTYILTNSGGGVFYNISNYLFNNNYLLFFVSFISFILITIIFNNNFRNILIFICIVLSNPQLTIWQANHSPTIFVLLLVLFNINFLIKKFKLENILQIYLYFILYILLTFIKNSLI